MKKTYIPLLTGLLLLSVSASAQKMRIDSTLLHETFETSSSTLSGWGAAAGSNCTSYNWTIANNASQGALSSSGYAFYQSSAASAGCVAVLLSPAVQAAQVDNNDSIMVDFYMYRASVSDTDNISIYFVDENGTIVHSPVKVYAYYLYPPAQSVGWGHLKWEVSYSEILANLTTSGFKVAFVATSAHGVNEFIDEVSISHISFKLIRSLAFVNDYKGDTLTAGDKTTIKWSSQNLSNIDVSYSTNNGSSYNFVTSVTASPSSYQWTIPSVPAIVTNTAFLRLGDDNDTTFHTSSGPFAIAWPEKLLNYNGGDSVMGGSTTKIEWRSRSTVSTVNIDFSIDGGVTYHSIATNVSSPANTNNTYTWAVPNVVSNTAKIKITDNNSLDVESNGYFKITHNSGIAAVNDKSYFSCYPNPAHNVLYLHFPNAIPENTVLNLYNISGKLLLTRSIPAGIIETSLDIHNIVNGVYILEMNNSKISDKQEIIVN